MRSEHRGTETATPPEGAKSDKRSLIVSNDIAFPLNKDSDMWKFLSDLVTTNQSFNATVSLVTNCKKIADRRYSINGGGKIRPLKCLEGDFCNEIESKATKPSGRELTVMKATIMRKIVSPGPAMVKPQLPREAVLLHRVRAGRAIFSCLREPVTYRVSAVSLRRQ